MGEGEWRRREGKITIAMKLYHEIKKLKKKKYQLCQIWQFSQKYYHGQIPIYAKGVYQDMAEVQ